MSLDVHLAETANSFAAHHDGWEDAARAYAHVSEPLFIVLVLLLAAAGLLLRRPRVLAASVLAVIAAGAGLLVAAVLARVVDRPRPFVAHPQIHPLYVVHSSSFPAGHAATAFAGAMVASYLARRAAPAFFALAALIGYSRVYVGVHYPSDVLAGALVGALVGLAGVLVLRWYLGRVERASAREGEREAPRAARQSLPQHGGTR